MKIGQLCDTLADQETRLLYLENSQPYHYPEPVEQKVSIPFELTRLQNRVQQLEAGFLRLQQIVLKNEQSRKKKQKDNI